MTMAEVNALNRPEFVDRIGWVFEHSPWVAEGAWESRPFEDPTALHLAMTRAMRRASAEKQIALLRAHPNLGARARMSEASVNEQAGAGLDHLRPDEFEELHRLNSEYKRKFGFPFLFAVKRSTKHDILVALRRRIALDKAAEFDEALTQVERIARFRIEDLIDGTIS